MDAPIYNYPTGAETDPDFLYQNLGTFWTQVFQEKATIKGYTMGQAEEMIQRYYDLLETLDAYAVKDIPIFHKEKWRPILVYKSKLNTSPLVWKEEDAKFGAQPESDVYYQNITFQFGYPKIPIQTAYTYFVGEDLKDAPIIANKVILPEVVLVNGTDYIIDDGTLIFNKDIFSDINVTKSPVIGENGEQVTFTTANGDVLNEELMILWIYHAQIDKEILWTNFGYIFDLKRDNDEGYKRVLQNLFNLYVEGPTVNAVRGVCAAFLGIPLVKTEGEIIEQVISDVNYHYVVTDLNVYRFSSALTLLPEVARDKVLEIGEILVDAVDFYDNSSYRKGWWKKGGVLGKKLALSQHLFLGNYEHQLVFENDLSLVTVNDLGEVVFPMEGSENDMKRFHDFINDPVRQATVKEALGVAGAGTSAPIYPVDWLMNNFLKFNTAAIRLKFSSIDVQANFLNLLPILRRELPPYVYLVFLLELQMDTEEYELLNDSVVIEFDAGEQTLNADGSNDAGELESLAPYGFRNVRERLFAIERGVPQPDYEVVGTSTTLNDEVIDAVADGRYLNVKDGAPLRQPPATLATTASFNTLLLLDFS